MTAVTVGSLCSGYGGLDRGLLSVIPSTVAWHAEVDPNACLILDERFPDVPNLGDITITDWTQVEPVDWFTAGYPCQPFSHAGRRKGKHDERHLWPSVAHAISVLRPGHVLLENVRGHLSLGLADVLAALSGLGYDSRWGVVRAADAGAPHGRARVFIVAADTCGERHGARRTPRSSGTPGPTGCGRRTGTGTGMGRACRSKRNDCCRRRWHRQGRRAATGAGRTRRAGRRSRRRLRSCR